MPILYSFRRCPFAIRARLALILAGIEVEIREVRLREKPPSLLELSPKGTVPVLVENQSVIDESLAVIEWTLTKKTWAKNATDYDLIAENDGAFKQALDRYKYAERFPEKSQTDHRADAYSFLAKLNTYLSQTPFLAGPSLGIEDIAILPFVRQCANVDRPWFDSTEHLKVQQWLSDWEGSELFRKVMNKYPTWSPDQASLRFPMDENLAGHEDKTFAFIKSLADSEFKISSALSRSFENAPPKNLRILLIRIGRDIDLSPASYCTLEALALEFFGI